VILVTGSTGFVGRHVVKELSSRGIEVRCLARSSSNLTPLNGLDISICYGDITDQASLETALENVEAVVHLVAIIRETKGATFERINSLGTRNLIQVANKMRVNRLIYMSNLGANDNQSFPLLYSKWLGEQEVIKSGIDFTILQPSVMFGRGDGFVCLLADIIKKLPVVPVIGSGKVKFQLISVEDVASCIAASLQNKKTINRIISLGGPDHLAYEEIINLIIQALKVKRIKVHVPVALMRSMVWAMEKILRHTPVTSTQLSMLERDNTTEVDVVERVFGFKPVSLRERIESILT